MGKNIGTIKYNNGGVYDDFFPRTVYGAITSSSDSATTLSDDLTSIKQKQETMKEKLDTVDRGANKYTHPSTSGNRHIPSGGSAGQVLKWSADGTAVWGSVEGKDGTIVNIVNREQTTQATNVNFIKNEIKQDSLSGLYDVSKNPNGNVLIDSVKSNNITLINAKIVDGKLTFPNNGNIKISNYINEDAFTIFLNLKDIKIKDIFFSIASFGSTCILVNQQNACAIMIEKNTNLVLLRTMYGLTSAKKLPYIEGWMAISYDGNSLTFANELGTVVTEIREFDKNNSYLFNSSVYDTAHVTLNDLILYDKNLTPTEILHNLSVLNSTPSICAIETTDSEGHKTRFSFSSDTDHITDRTGRTQEDINRTLYKKFCSKFTSNGEDIVIDNGLDGYMLSGKLEGHTVKNVLQPSDYNNKHLYSPGTFVDDYYIDGSKTPYNMFKIQDIKFEVGKEYTLCVEIVENTLKKDAWGGHMGCIFNFTPKAGQVGVFYEKKTLKSLDNLKWIFYFTLDNDYDSSVEKLKYRFWVTENGYSDSFFTGLSSTQAIITNNGEKYSFYASEEDKAQGKVIELNGVDAKAKGWNDLATPYDTLEILEDGGGIYMQNIFKVNIKGTEIFTEAFLSKNGTHVVYVAPINYAYHNVNSVAVVDKYQFKRWIEGYNEKLDETYVGYGTVPRAICISLPIEIAPTVEDLEKYLQETGGFEMVGQLKTPIVTNIPKELMPPIIPTYETNNFTFGEGVKPSNATVALPTSDNVKKEYNTTLLNNYTQTVNTFAPYVSLMKDNKTVKIQMDLTSPGTGINGAIFALPAELRPKTNTKIIVFINGKSELAEIKASDGNVIAYVPSKNSNVYINTEYMRGLFNG